MSNHDLARNKELACQFMDNVVRKDLAAMDRLLHEDFVWNVAVTPDDAPNALRPMQSKLLAGMSLWHKTPRMDREQSMKLFKHLFEVGSVETDAPAAGGANPYLDDEKYRFRFKVHGLTAEEDRVAMEAESWQPNPNGRLYNQLYHYLFRVKDDRIVLYKEYQDTLHLFDYMAD